jgi:isopentenyl-diphosphate delta-isomerase type 1
MFDVVDEHDRVIGQASRAEVHASRLRHRAVHVLLFNPHRELFVQKRSAVKDTHPRCYDSSASGHLRTGEDYDVAARRELCEELGLRPAAAAFRRLFKIEACQETDWEFVWVYAVVGNYQPNINVEEIESGAFWPLPAVDDLVGERPGQCAPAFCRIIGEIRARGFSAGLG